MKKSESMKLRNSKGITMIALVVTVVVILILAGISINAIVGDNGIIKRAKEENNNALVKKVQDEIKRTVTEYDIANKGETLEEYLKNNIPGKVDEVTRIDDKTLAVKKDGVTVEVESESREFAIIVTPYVGVYDGSLHNALASISVTPSEATLEYSTDGKTFSENMPQIINASTLSVTVRVSRAGYKTMTVTEVAKVSKAEGQIKLSSVSGTYTYPTGGTFTVSGNTGTLSVASNNTNIASISVSGNTVTIKPGTTAGKATITVTSAESSNYTAKSATYTATVQNGTISLGATPYTGTYDGKAHNAITSVRVTPSDAKLEYSINGGTYSTTMPTVTNSSSYTVTVRASKAGYKTQSTTQTVIVNKAEGSIWLSSYSGTLMYPNTGSFTVGGNTGTLSVWSSNTGIATVGLSGNTVYVYPGMTAGTITITVSSAESGNYTAKSVTYTLTVQDPTFTGNSGVGYYADVDGDGTVDGVIFADFKNGGSGKWGSGQEELTSYTIPTSTGLKEYYVSQTNYVGPFGKKDVLAIKGSGSGNSRFYVMALSDYSDSATFATARSTRSNGWSTPTTGTWLMFAGQLGITTSNYSGYGLKYTYWTSSCWDSLYGYGEYIDFNVGFASTSSAVGEKRAVRLYYTF